MPKHSCYMHSSILFTNITPSTTIHHWRRCFLHCRLRLQILQILQALNLWGFQVISRAVRASLRTHRGWMNKCTRAESSASLKKCLMFKPRNWKFSYWCSKNTYIYMWWGRVYIERETVRDTLYMSWQVYRQSNSQKTIIKVLSWSDWSEDEVTIELLQQQPVNFEEYTNICTCSPLWFLSSTISKI